MIEDARGRIDYDVCGAGQTLCLCPGRAATGAAWRPVMAAWDNRFRCVTTSLLGYGGTAERRTAARSVYLARSRRRGVGHPQGRRSASILSVIPLAAWWRSLWRLRNRVPLASLAVIEAPAAELLRDKATGRTIAHSVK